MDIAKSFADTRVIELIQEKTETSPKLNSPNGKKDEAKKQNTAKDKVPK